MRESTELSRSAVLCVLERLRVEGAVGIVVVLDVDVLAARVVKLTGSHLNASLLVFIKHGLQGLSESKLHISLLQSAALEAPEG